MLLSATLPVALLAGCGNDVPTDAAKDDPMSATAIAFNSDQQAWRDQRAARLLEPDGWASLTGLHWISPGAHYVGSDADTAPSEIGFDDGKGRATVIKRGDRYALRVRHAEAPTRTGFSGLDYWPADPDWRVDATFVANPPGQTIEVANIIGTTDQVPNPGAIEFERDGKVHRIEALDEGGDELFLVFADRTNGHGSYGAGRFLYVPKPDATGHLPVDFNRAYNPPCAFTAFATCPLPPPENRLDLAITAGEKAYGH